MHPFLGSRLELLMSSALFTRGIVSTEEGRRYVEIQKNLVGCVVWGPYERLVPGSYSISFEIYPYEINSIDEIVCRIDVAAKQGNEVLTKKDVFVGELLSSGNRLEIIFEVNENATLEYRVFGTNRHVRVAYYRRARRIDLGLHEKSVQKALEENDIYTDNFDRICYFGKFGVEFSLIEGGLIAKVHDIILGIRNEEDFQLIDEIFFSNDYNVLPPYTCIAIDIGMNVGIASLALARRSEIESVLSYEPYVGPFNRAIQNFKYNPRLSAKIRPRNFGLGDQDQELTVLSNQNTTIGMSIRGAATGNRECIRIRDAGRELRTEIENANRRGTGVVLKIDCEGSEFGIFDSLQRESLFHRIDAFMIEWHKWWSVTKTQGDLIRPLKEAGFFVFDRTHPGHEYSGLLLAVRSSRVDKRA
jgi:FkbM family methyltransferase